MLKFRQTKKKNKNHDNIFSRNSNKTTTTTTNIEGKGKTMKINKQKENIYIYISLKRSQFLEHGYDIVYQSKFPLFLSLLGMAYTIYKSVNFCYFMSSIL